MKLWTIQTEPAWNFMQQRGHLRGLRTYAARDSLAAYDWMVTQMRDRIAQPPSTRESLPIWAWQQYEGVHRKRPDLRSSGHLPTGTRGYRIGFTAPEGDVLLSDFELWHYVLNYWYLASSESDREAFRSRHQDLGYSWSTPPDDPHVDAEIKSSWHRIFDLNWDVPYFTAAKAQKSIQATLWQIDESWISTVDEFVAR